MSISIANSCFVNVSVEFVHHAKRFYFSGKWHGRTVVRIAPPFGSEEVENESAKSLRLFGTYTEAPVICVYRQFFVETASFTIEINRVGYCCQITE